jgi:hypothetical protein
MDIQAVKQKIIKGEISDDELAKLLIHKAPSQPRREKPTFLNTILKGFVDGYAEPHLWRLILEISLIFVVVLAVVLLAYSGKIDSTIAVVLLAFVLGFIFGKMK